jgi:hypothetical protein
MTQPNDIPSFASDTNYPTGEDAWSDSPTKVRAPAGELAVGHVPGERTPAHWENYILANLHDHIRAIADLPAAMWSDRRTTTITGAHANANLLSGGSRIWTRRNGDNLYSTFDGHVWTISTTTVFTPVDATYGAMGGTDYLVVFDATGAVKKSSDNGATWTSAGASNAGMFGIIYFNGVFINFGVDAIFTSTDLSTWTSRTVPAGWSGLEPVRAKISPNEVLIFQTAPGTAIRSDDGINWDETGAISGSAFIDAAYSESASLWMAFAGTSTYSSANGEIWTAVGTASGTPIRCVAHGRNWVYIASGRVIYTSDGATFKEVPALAVANSDFANYETIINHKGMMVIGYQDGDTLEYRLSAPLL